MITRIKQLTVLVGDIVLLYGALFLTLLIRYQSIQHVDAHLIPFSCIFIVWIILLYAFGFYEIKNLKNTIEFGVLFLLAIGIGMISAIVLFYLIPYFHISPKTNLVIFSGVFVVLGLLWRFFFNTATRGYSQTVLVIGNSSHAQEILSYITNNPHVGYVPLHVSEPSKEHIQEALKNNPDYVIYDPELFEHEGPFSTLSQLLVTSHSISYHTHEFYELLLKKVPLTKTSYTPPQQSFYLSIRPLIEKIVALILCIILLPLLILIYLLVALTSKGGGIYLQERIGKHETPFLIYKFRTMVHDAEKQGPQFATHRDPRITLVGRFLRFTHLDELPQLINVIKGDLSFVGPRPERPQFVSQLKKQIPLYSLRHTIQPGITGWAQVQYRYGSNKEDAEEKLRFDLYYVKHQSFFLDLIILTKTIKMVFFNYK